MTAAMQQRGNGSHARVRSGRRKTRVQVVDFFSGCGGMSYGFATAPTRNVEFDVRGGIDIDLHANATFARMVGIEPLSDDVRQLLEPGKLQEAVRHWGLSSRNPLLLIGCAPCQGFSSHRKKDRRHDGRNGLLEAFARITVALGPDLVVMENVPEMLGAKHWRHFSAWREVMIEAGYHVRA